MTFLNPAVLLGLLAASIPILIHLLNLRKLKRVEFSSLMFLKELQKNQIRKIKLKQWLLLLIRVMIVILLVTAFARPTLESAIIGGTASTVKTTAIFIIDDSFSMEVLEPNGSRFNITKNIVKELLSNLKEGDDASIIYLSDKDGDEKQSSKNISEMSNQISGKNISFVSGSVHNAFAAAAKLLDNSQNFAKEIYFISDFQKTNEDAQKVYSDFGKVFNERVKLFLFRFDEKDINNLSIDSLRLNTQLFEKNKPVSISAFVNNHSAQKIDNRVISLFINGERSAQKGFTINGGSSAEIILEGNIKSSGFNKIIVETEEDELNADNKKYISFFLPEKINALVAVEKSGDEKFITALLNAFGENSVDYSVKNISQINSSMLKDFDLVYLIGARDEISSSIKSYAQNGGGVFLFPSSVSDINSLNIFMSSLSIPLFKQKIIVDDENGSDIFFAETDFNHPIFQNLFENKKEKEIESPTFTSYFQIPRTAGINNIISMPDRSAFLAEHKLGKGKLFILNVSPTMEHSNLPLKSVFVTMLIKSMFYLSIKENTDNSAQTGDELFIELSNFPQRKIRVISPSQNEEFINESANEGKNIYGYSKTFEPGFYKFFSGNELKDLRVINGNANESQQEYFSKDDFEKYLDEINFKGNKNWIDISSNFSEEITRARFGSELWKIFLIAALLFALLEMFVARTAKKDLVSV